MKRLLLTLALLTSCALRRQYPPRPADRPHEVHYRLPPMPVDSFVAVADSLPILPWLLERAARRAAIPK